MGIPVDRVASGNIFENASPPAAGEIFEPLLSVRNLVVERILSSSRIEPVEYRQTQEEWVLLLRGEATVSVAGEIVRMKEGDFVFLPAGTPHSVLDVTDGAIWLGVHLHPVSPTAASATIAGYGDRAAG
jgi:cupin 2 domain-containing protein